MYNYVIVTNKEFFDYQVLSSFFYHTRFPSITLCNLGVFYIVITCQKISWN